MWILLVVYQFDTFATVLETAEECQKIGLANLAWWAETAQKANAICMMTLEA